MRGYSLIELLFVLCLVGILGSIAIPIASGTIDYIHTAGAARHIAARIAAARIEAVRRSATIALRFDRDGGDYSFTPFLDGNGNGIRAVDIAAGSDRPLAGPQRLSHQFARTSFGLLPGLPDLNGATGGTDGVRIGPSSFLSISPDGSCTGGTLYVRGRHSQFAVRVLGATGRVRFFRYETGARRWITK